MTGMGLSVVTRFPCSPTQMQFLMFDAMGQGPTALNYAFRYRIDGPVRIDVLQQAFELLIERHEILRTGFAAVSGKLVQEVSPLVHGRVQLHDYSHLTEAAANLKADEAGHAEAALPFDLQRPPLVRFTLLKIAPERFQLLITAHATVIDGWSLSILLGELGCALAAFHAGRAPELPAVDMHFGDYAMWQAEMSRSGAFNADMAYWKRELDGVSPFRLPPSRRVPDKRTYPSITRGIWLPKADTERARGLAQSRGATFYQVALAALAAMLQRRTGEAEVVIGTQVSGRNEEDAEGITGPLINAVVLRLAVSPDAALSQLLAQAAEKSANALAHQGLPFASMVEAAAPVQATQRNPIYAINFALQAAFIHDDNADFKSYGPFAIHSLPSSSNCAIWELNFGLVERPDGWRMSCEADGELFDAGFIDEMLADWGKSLSCFANQPGLTLGLLPVTGAAVRDAPAPTPPPKPVAAITELAASRLPADDRVIIFNKRAAGVPIMALNVTSLYHGLASADPSRPFYDIQLPDEDAPKRFTPRAIQDLTTDAVRMIRRARPSGPYVILGYCVAGTIALEAARRLRDEGEAVPLVVMIDTWAPGYREDLPWLAKRLRTAKVRLHQWKLDIRDIRAGKFGFGELMANIGRRQRAALLRRIWSALGLPESELVLANTDHPFEWYLDQIHFAYRYHRPEPYDGRVLLFRATEVCEGSTFPRDFGWSAFLSGAYEIADFPGVHTAALSSPGLDAIARDLGRVVADIDVAAAVSPGLLRKN